MDTHELDQWLDGDDDDADHHPAGGRGAWPPERSAPPAGSRRPRWLWPAIAGAVAWLAVGVAVMTGGADDDRVAAASDDPFAVPGAGTGVAEGAAPAPPGTGATPPVAEPSPGSGSQDVTGDDPTADDDVPTGGASEAEGGVSGRDEPDTGLAGGASAGAASIALRRHLTARLDGRVGYLELATAVGAQPIKADAVVVLVDAVWLEGDGDVLDEVLVGRWAVPVTTDGSVLGTPWLVPGGPPVDDEPLDPPLGALRLPEVEQAMRESGWGDVTAAASDPHPWLTGVLVAVVDGVAPSGAVRTGDVVWLVDRDGGLELLGARP
jgi:hypothetical protein